MQRGTARPLARAPSRSANRVGGGRRGGLRWVVRVDIRELVGSAPHARSDEPKAAHLVAVLGTCTGVCALHS